MKPTADLVTGLRGWADDLTSAGDHGLPQLLRGAAERLGELTEWKLASTAPADSLGMAVIVRFLCSCAPTGRTVTIAGRMRGRWIVDTAHDIEIEWWAPLPAMPALLDPRGGVQ